jgi:hypothetical protein
MRIKRIILPGILLLCFASPWAIAQNAGPRLEFFAEAGGSYLNTGPAQGSVIITCLVCAVPASPDLSEIVPLSSSVSTAGRLFTGARFRFTRHDAIEASYSFSPNRFAYLAESHVVASAYSRVDLLSFNYVHYLWIRTRLQPFATAGIGTNRFRGGPAPSAVPGGTAQVPAGYTISFVNPPDNGWQFAWNYGGGADVVMQRHLALRLEIRNYVADQPIPLTGTSHNLVPSAGIVLRFK